MRLRKIWSECIYKYRNVFIIFWSILLFVDLFLLLYGGVLLIENGFCVLLSEITWRNRILYGVFLLIILFLSKIVYKRLIVQRYDNLRAEHIIWKIEQQKMYEMLLTQKIVALEHEQLQFDEQIKNISNMLQQRKAVEIKQYLGTLTGKNNMLVIQKLTGNMFLDVLLSEKLYIAQQNKVSLEIDYQPDISLKNILEYDICILLGNLLDNAIEAAAKSKKRIVLCELQMKSCYWDSIIVHNSSDVSPVLKNGLPISQKSGEEHGYGIKIIQQKVQQYRGTVVFEYDEQQKLFSANILLPRSN